MLGSFNKIANQVLMIALSIVLTGLSPSFVSAQEATKPAKKSNKSTNIKKTSTNLASSQMKLAAPTSQVKPSRFSGNVGTSYGRNLVRHNDETDYNDVSYSLGLRYVLTDLYSTSLRTSLSQAMKDGDKTDFGRTSLGFSRSAFNFSSMTLGPSISFAVPLSQQQKDRESLKTSVTLAGQLGVQLSKNKRSFLSRVDLGAGLSATRNIHKYETTTTGSINTQYSSVQSLSASYNFTDKLSVGLSGSHINNWSYNGKMRDAFEFSQEIGYAPLKALSLAVGHSNGGSTLRADGYASNIEILNENTSTIYGSASYSF